MRPARTIAPAMAERQGGYTRMLKIGKRSSDASEMVILEWTDVTVAPVVFSSPVAPITCTEVDETLPASTERLNATTTGSSSSTPVVPSRSVGRVLHRPT